LTPDVAAVARRLAALGVRPDVPFRAPDRLVEALTHASCGQPYDNQRLEMLGDAVLGHLVARLLFDLMPEAREGELSRTRATLVDEPSLAAKARWLGLGPALGIHAGEVKAGGRDRDSILSDAFEALLAALYLSEGQEVADKLVRAAFEPELRAGALDAGRSRDHKSSLQARAQAAVGVAPTYRTVATEGPSHEPTFVAEAVIARLPVGTGRGRTKKAAEQEAARAALDAWDAIAPALAAAVADPGHRD
jgi:ribonuclease-3